MSTRIVIFGNSGSGKSTLAAKQGLPHLDLDTMAWRRDRPTERRPLEDSLADLAPYLAGDDWVVEGCYASLLGAAIARCTRLVFLNPGVEACVANCRARPWEPHKYESLEAQDRNLAMLLDWVRQYETRDDEFSLRAHRELFDGFAGEKTEITDVR